MLGRCELYLVLTLCAPALSCGGEMDPRETPAARPANDAPSSVSGPPSGTGAPAGVVVSADASSTPGAFGVPDAGSAPAYIDAALGPTHVPFDPNVSFAWDASATDSRGCQPGTYVGTYSCPVVLAEVFEGDSAPVAEGPVTLTLTKSQNGEFLEISGGHLQLSDPDGLAELQADIVGKLDCRTNALEGKTVDGVYGPGEANLLPAGTFEGEVSGTLDRAHATLRGTWKVTWEALGFPGTCNGPFTASWMP
jgi:hypothetical protein